MAIDRGAPIHGTGWTIGDIVDAAAGGGSGGGSPQPGQPTRFLTLTYHHPGNEDGNSVSATTGILIPDFICQERGYWLVSNGLISVVKSSDATLMGYSPIGPYAYSFGPSIMRNPGEDSTIALQPPPSYGTGIGLMNYFWSTTAEAEGDPQLAFRLDITANQFVLFIYGMSTNTPTDWTLNVQLTPIAP